MGIIKKGKDYFIQYSVYELNKEGERERKQKQEKIGPSRALAEAALSKRVVERAENKIFDKKPVKKILLKEFMSQYLEYSKSHKKPSMYERDCRSSLHLLKYFSGCYLDGITPKKAEDYKSERRKSVKGSTINRELALLRSVLNKAVEWGDIETSPIKKMKMFREPPGRVRYLSRQEIPALLRECSCRIKPIVCVALYTGMRKGEILALKWKNIDFEQGIIHVEEVEFDGEVDSPKSGERRDVPICDIVKKSLEALPRTGERIFEGVKDFREAFNNACKRAGIEDFHFHDLRHTFASHLVMQGTSIMIVKELLGHKTLEMTLRYAHLAPDVRRKAIMDLEKGLNPES
jgi:integrase